MAKNITVPYVSVSDFDWGLNLEASASLPWNPTIWSLVAALTALPLWMTLELTVSVLYVFQRWSGLYFYAVLITAWSISLHAIGFLLSYCVPSCNWIASSIMTELGWVGMVTGFSLVLYSRLNLMSFIMRNRHISRIALAMIITNAVLFHIPTFVVFMIGVSSPGLFVKYISAMNALERVQIVMFSVQELILSGLYIYGTFKMAQDSFNSRIRRTIVLLITVQIAAVCCSALLIVLDFAGYYILKSFIHSFVYAIKLKLEFVILNEFRRLVTQASSGPGSNEKDLTMASNGALFPFLKKQDSPAGGRVDEIDMEIRPV
uniref:Inositol 1,4,5-trisphosphate receptor type 1 n=1 Tax=Talaromyces marneffei PM1 TaxID=1077442 RepID=A0A093VFC9_TALMA